MTGSARRWRRSLLAGVLCAAPWSPALAQAPADRPGAATLPFARFAEQVAANHPVAQQARLVATQARLAVQEAWGGFDPKISLSTAQKAYKGSPYYAYVDAALKVPTPFGADIKLAYDRSTGPKISPDLTTPTGGLWSLGLTLPLGQRIRTDERRTALTVARAQRELGDAEQQGLINKLLLDAAKAYGAWYAASARRTVALEGVRLARFRMDAVLLRVRNGESAPVDTLEASLELQRRSVTLAESETEARAARLIAETYLWDVRGNPVTLADSVQPELAGLERSPTDTARLVAWIAQVSERHPEIRKLEAKLRTADAEQLLARQGLLPNAEASLAALADRADPGLLTATDRWEANYKAGLSVESSLLLLKERGKAARSAQKTEYARLDRDRVRRDLVVGLRLALNDLLLLEQLLGAQRTAVQLATRLRDAEQARFVAGESTLLVVTLRERLVLDEAVKLAALEGKLVSARAALAVALGDGALPTP